MTTTHATTTTRLSRMDTIRLQKVLKSLVAAMDALQRCDDPALRQAADDELMDVAGRFEMLLDENR
ncbi:MAG: hypothetical protein HY873_09935 [Chloroflexi bacterium]|nr:hypothetical protein [Chloroflexota bacterium]